MVSAVASLCGLVVVGLLVDYFNRRKVMLIETFGTLIATAAARAGADFRSCNIAYLFIFSFVVGFVQTIDSPYGEC